ncbi:hypothetical protein BpHYR1_024753 [Brachionus plicatilis]|uniref:HAT C-terminal dimerisation domain-containing protein n=1 Tax=Brachionus plicatilis TaxID=10195 RepID=A0A3M7T595_BRAPC|nr:hypothetical protein BpHYR1_024753 [Brachionus plicatilis]
MLLAVRHILGGDTARNLSDNITCILDEFSILRKTKFFTTDNVSTMLQMSKNLGLKRIPCISHLLNLFVSNCLKAIKQTIIRNEENFPSENPYMTTQEIEANDNQALEKCISIASYFNHSTMMKEELMKKQSEIIDSSFQLSNKDVIKLSSTNKNHSTHENKSKQRKEVQMSDSSDDETEIEINWRSVEKEIMNYKLEPKTNRLTEFWNDNKNKYPILFKYFKTLASAQATSTPSERIFSRTSYQVFGSSWLVVGSSWQLVVVGGWLLVVVVSVCG